MAANNIIYDVLLVEQSYKPVVGYVGPEKYTCIFYDEDREKALKEINKYVKQYGFVTPDRKYTIKDVVLRERTCTGDVISITPYIEIFDGLDRRRALKNETKAN